MADLVIKNINWQKVKLGELADLIPGFAFKSGDFTTAGTPVIKIRNIASGTLTLDNLEYFAGDMNSLDKYKINKGDILVSMTGSHVSQWSSVVGKITRNNENQVFLMNQRVGRIKPNPAKVDNDFLYYSLHNDETTLNLANRAGGSANQANISPEIIKSLEIIIPELGEQKKIASILSSFDDKIEINNKIAKTLEEMAQAIFKEWFVHFHFPGYKKVKMVDSGTEYGMTPENWESRKLGDKLNILKGKNITKNTITHGKIPVVAGGLNPAYYHNKANAQCPVITISASGANSGFVNLYQEDVWVSDCSYIDRKTTSFVYFYYLFLKNKQIEITGLQRGSAQPHVYPKDLMQLTIIDIPEMLTNAFEQKVELMFGALKNLKNQNQCLRQTRDLLLPKLMRGEVRV